MRIAVAGATGNIGSLTVAALEREGHDVVRISRSLGVDLTTGEGLDEALTGVEAVVDATNAPPLDEADDRGALRAGSPATCSRRRHGPACATTCCSRSWASTGSRATRTTPASASRSAWSRAGPVPWTIVPATQFHDFAAMVAGWTESDGVATIAPLLVQPIAPADVAEVLAEVAVGEPQGRYADVAGPDPQDLVDMARRTFAARGRDVKLVPTWSRAVRRRRWPARCCCPGEDARIAPTTFDDWLATAS